MNDFYGQQNLVFVLAVIPSVCPHALDMYFLLNMAAGLALQAVQLQYHAFRYLYFLKNKSIGNLIFSISLHLIKYKRNVTSQYHFPKFSCLVPQTNKFRFCCSISKHFIFIFILIFKFVVCLFLITVANLLVNKESLLSTAQSRCRLFTAQAGMHYKYSFASSLQ